MVSMSALSIDNSGVDGFGVQIRQGLLIERSRAQRNGLALIPNWRTYREHAPWESVQESPHAVRCYIEPFENRPEPGRVDVVAPHCVRNPDDSWTDS